MEMRDIITLLESSWDLPFAADAQLEGWIAMWNDKRLEIYVGKDADDLWSAKQFAIKTMRIPKSKQGLLSVTPAYKDINEARVDSPDVSYVETGKTKAKTIEKEYDRVTAEVSGRLSEKFTKLAIKWKQIKEYTDLAKKIQKEVNVETKDIHKEFFDAADAIYTRVIKTKSLILTMSIAVANKEIVSETFDFEAFIEAVIELVGRDLEPMILELAQKHTKVSKVIKAGSGGRLTAKTVDESARSTNLGKVKAFATKTKNKIESDLSGYDAKLDQIKSKYLST